MTWIRSKVVWWHMTIAVAAILLYLASRMPLARVPGILDDVALGEIKQWSTGAARWSLLAALVLALCGRGGAALACGGMALGLITSLLGEWGRDAVELIELQREIDPEFAAGSLGELIEWAPGTVVLGAGVVLWLAALLVMVVRPGGVRRSGRADSGD